MRSHLALPDIFSIQLTADHIRMSSYGAPYTFVSETRFRRLLKVAGSARLVEFSLEPVGKSGRLITTILEPTHPQEHPAGSLKADLTGVTRLVFGMDDDLEAVYAQLNRFPRLGRLVDRYNGLRLVKAPDLYEALLITILGQQVSVAAAQSQRRRLMTAYGEKIRFEDREYFGMPDPEKLVDIGDVGLREIGISRQKSRYLIEMARGVANGPISFGAFHGVSCETAIEQLMEIPGVGRWTAEIVAMRGLGFQDVFPAGDLGLQKAVQQTFGMDHRPSEGALRKLSNRWKGNRSYAALYLWMTLVEDGYA